MEQTKNFHHIWSNACCVNNNRIGFTFCKKRDFSSVDYFFGGKKLKSLPVAFSFIVTFQSSLMILGVPAEVYGYGLKSALQNIGIMIAFISGAVITVPVFRPLQITSIYKYFNLRYGSNEVRFIAAAMGVIYLVFYMSIVVLGTCVALKSVLKVPFWVTVITYTAITALYTSLGGFVAVIWTDVFQLFVMLTGILATLIKSTANAGGPSVVYTLAEERFHVRFSIRPYSTLHCVDMHIWAHNPVFGDVLHPSWSTANQIHARCEKHLFGDRRISITLLHHLLTLFLRRGNYICILFINWL